MAKHIYIRPDDPTHNCKNDEFCMVCDGGLSLCKVCGGLEGGLPTDCPQHLMTADEMSQVHKGEIDFRGGEWVTETSPHSPAAYNKTA